ncbi:MAG TPA: hypothetical protein VIN60_08045 [Anaerolineales bacterium]
MTARMLTLLALTILISACSPWMEEFAPTSAPTPIDTVVEPDSFSPTPTLNFTVIATEIPTLIPTPKPMATAVPINTATATMQNTLTPDGIETSAYAQITALSVEVSTSFTSCASTNSVSFTGTVTSSNETDIQYKWLLSGTTSYASAVRYANISTAGTMTIRGITLKLKCGNYTVGLQIIYPNPVTEKRHFSIP